MPSYLLVARVHHTDDSDSTATVPATVACGFLTVVYDRVTDNLPDLISLFDDFVKDLRRRAHWFIPKQPKVARVRSPLNSHLVRSGVIRGRRVDVRVRRGGGKGSGWKRDGGHFVMRVC